MGARTKCYGKTTLCKILAGYLEPCKGQILLDGKPLPKKGYCPVQMIWQHPELSVNPRFRMRDVLEEGDQIEERMIKALGIEKDWLNRFPSELSGGELQRVCLGRLLLLKPGLLILDEPTSMLDVSVQAQIIGILKEVQEEKKYFLSFHFPRP